MTEDTIRTLAGMASMGMTAVGVGLWAQSVGAGLACFGALLYLQIHVLLLVHTWIAKQ